MIVNPNDATSDAGWFADHPGRKFRCRLSQGCRCIVRARPNAGEHNVFLRVRLHPAAAAPGDNDPELAVLWFRTA
jgi:hypothetical protein